MVTKNMTHIKHFNEMRFTVVATPDRCKVSFVIYDIAGWNEGITPGVFDAPCWHKAESAVGRIPLIRWMRPKFI